MLFKTQYRIVWTATSDRTTTMRKVIVEGKSFVEVQQRITKHEEEAHQYCKVFFDSLEALEGYVLWK